MSVSDKFMFYEASVDGAELKKDITELFIEFAEAMDELTPNSREKSIMMTKLEEAAYFAKASVARDLETR